jgi:hypothetical protein
MLLIRWAFLVGRNGDGEWRDICHDHDIGENQPSTQMTIFELSHATIRFVGVTESAAPPPDARSATCFNAIPLTRRLP